MGSLRAAQGCPALLSRSCTLATVSGRSPGRQRRRVDQLLATNGAAGHRHTGVHPLPRPRDRRDHRAVEIGEHVDRELLARQLVLDEWVLSSVPSASSVPRSAMSLTPREPAPLAASRSPGTPSRGRPPSRSSRRVSGTAVDGEQRSASRYLSRHTVASRGSVRQGLFRRRGTPPGALRSPAAPRRRSRTDVDPVCRAQRDHLVDERLRASCRHDPAVRGGHEIETAGEAVHVGGEHVDVAAGEQRADDRDAGRSPGAGHENCCHALFPLNRAPWVIDETGTEMSAVSRMTSSGSQFWPPPNRDQ